MSPPGKVTLQMPEDLVDWIRARVREQKTTNARVFVEAHERFGGDLERLEGNPRRRTRSMLMAIGVVFTPEQMAEITARAAEVNRSRGGYLEAVVRQLAEEEDGFSGGPSGDRDPVPAPAEEG